MLCLTSLIVCAYMEFLCAQIARFIRIFSLIKQKLLTFPLECHLLQRVLINNFSSFQNIYPSRMKKAIESLIILFTPVIILHVIIVIDMFCSQKTIFLFEISEAF